ncbi:hypothetical protein ACFZCL_03815 [Streptomyces sp. NPDC008159]|uniref:hypothetical protein n=1 Tax=Streptomyces sp. NPDC008159 TaxID=3364817 RepID=UPI0036E9A23B
MAAMRRGLLLVLAWLLATGAAVTLSWWGVHTVMAGTAYDPPRALPITAAGAKDPGKDGEEPARVSDTARPSPSPGAGRPERQDGPGRNGTGTASPTPTKSPRVGPSPGAGTSGDSPDSGEVKAYDTEGGRVVFSLTRTYATLVSATPGSGWSMQVWKTESWIRVDFAAGSDRVSVFCTWHDSAPRVDVQNF